MSKRLLLLVVLVCVAGVGVQAESFSQQVMAQIQPMLQVVWPNTELRFGDLTIGANETDTMPLQILSNVGYTVVLETTNPHLVEYFSLSKEYGTTKLVEPLKVSIDNGVTWKTVEPSMILVDNKDCSIMESTFELKYQQLMSFPGDKALRDGSVYRTEINLLVTPVI